MYQTLANLFRGSFLMVFVFCTNLVEGALMLYNG